MLKSTIFKPFVCSIFTAVVCICTALTISASDTADAQEMTREAEALLTDFMSNADTLRADFTQIVIDEEGRKDDAASSSGVFLLERPGKFRWQVTEPNDLLILADGKNLWNYDIELEQVTVKPIDETLSGTPAMLLSGEADILEAFNINGSFVTVYDEETVQWLELTPVKTHNDFSNLRLGFSESEIRIMELSTNVGQVIRIEFLSAVRNIELDEKLFKFSAPDYVDIIGEAL